MAISNKALRQWLDTLHSDVDVAIDGDALRVCDRGRASQSIEIGGEYINTVDLLQPLPTGRV